MKSDGGESVTSAKSAVSAAPQTVKELVLATCAGFTDKVEGYKSEAEDL